MSDTIENIKYIKIYTYNPNTNDYEDSGYLDIDTWINDKFLIHGETPPPWYNVDNYAISC